MSDLAKPLGSRAHITIAGGGAIGCVWAAHLARAGNRVSIVDVSPQVIEALNARGILVDTPTGPLEPVPVQATSRPEEVEAADIVFFFVKAHHTATAAEMVASLVGPETAVVTQQNGWGNADVLARFFAPEQIVVGVTYHSATVVAPGRVRHTGKGAGFAGPFVDGGEMTQAERVGDVMSRAGLETTVTSQVKTEIWKKLILNAATLPTAALTRLRAGDLGQPGPLQELLKQITVETVQVARALGYAIDPQERVERVLATLGNAGTGKPSMLQDVEAGRKTEIEVVSGAVIRAAAQAGIDAPLNRALFALVAGLERDILGHTAD
jgi:2-dehydropantoate 2-reductase